MIFFLVLAVALWFFGRSLGWSTDVRLLAIAMLYLGFVLILVLSWMTPAGNQIKLVLGSLGQWLVVGGIVGLIFAYGFVLKHLRLRARDVQVEVQPAVGEYAREELPRYMRHIMLREIGGPGQKKLKGAKILVIGAGGLGSPALMYLAAAGVGTIGVIDDDVVEDTNLQRQIAHTDERIGMPKVFSAEAAMKEVNPYVEVRPYHRRLEAGIVDDLVGEYDLVLDGTDNFATRYMANAACVKAGVPLVSGALTQWEGQVSVFFPVGGAPCYKCVFPQAPADGLAPSCAEAGVAGPLPGVVGSIMAIEAVKLITGAGEALLGRMMIYDALYSETRVIKLSRREGCDVCN